MIFVLIFPIDGLAAAAMFLTIQRHFPVDDLDINRTIRGIYEFIIMRMEISADTFPERLARHVASLPGFRPRTIW